MAVFIVDASVTLAWCFEDEASSWTDELLQRLRHGDRITVPAHWSAEITNGLLVALRRKRIKPRQPVLFWDELARLPIEMEPSLTASQAKAILTFSERYALTVYDAAYLELAYRRRLPRGTLDDDLRKAAQAEGIILV